MALEEFPLHLLDTKPGTIWCRKDVFDIVIGLQPFDLDGKKVSTEFRLDGLALPVDGPSSWAGKAFDFPSNPEPGYVDGSIYLRHAHNPADLTRIEFGEF